MGIQLPVGKRDLFQHSLLWGMILRQLVKRFRNLRPRNVVIFTGLRILPRTLLSPETSEYVYVLRSLIHPTEQDPQLLCCDKLKFRKKLISLPKSSDRIGDPPSFIVDSTSPG
jgi:hypothetical protein